MPHIAIKLRSLLLPIHRSELALFLPLLGMAFLTCVNYNVLRCLKDALLVAEVGSGACIIPFLKLWAVLPATLLASLLIARALRRTSWKTLLGGAVLGFTAFFLLFALVLYPLRTSLQAAMNLSWLPPGFAPLASAVRHWPLTLFYVAAETWKIHILMVLFWGLVNQMTSLDQGKRFYSLLIFAGSLAAVFAGPLTTWTAQQEELSLERILLRLTCVLVSASAGLLLLLTRLPGPPRPPQQRAVAIREALATARANPILIGLGCIIIVDYIAFNLTEVLWKESLYQACKNPQSYCAYMGRVVTGSGVIAALSSLFLSGNLMRRFSWRAVSLIPVGAGFALSSAFFLLLLSKSSYCVLAGALHNALMRSLRDSFKDPANQLAYSALSKEAVARGKPLVCGICPTVGKTMSSLLQQGSLLLSPTLQALGPYAGAAALGCLGLWGRMVWTTAAKISGQSREREREIPSAA